MEPLVSESIYIDSDSDSNTLCQTANNMQILSQTANHTQPLPQNCYHQLKTRAVILT